MWIVPEIWPSWARLADDLGVSYQTAYSWSRRGIPPRRFPEILRAAHGCGVELTFDALHGFNAQQRAAPVHDAA